MEHVLRFRISKRCPTLKTRFRCPHPTISSFRGHLFSLALHNIINETFIYQFVWITYMQLVEGKFTVETFARKKGLGRQSAINLLSRLKKQGFARVSGGGRQKRIYTISRTPVRTPNGFFYLLNKYSPEKVHPSFEHYVHGKYGAERAIIDGLLLSKKDVRIREAMLHLFRHVNDWKKLFDMARKEGIEKDVRKLYGEARQKTRCRTMPRRYEK